MSLPDVQFKVPNAESVPDYSTSEAEHIRKEIAELEIQFTGGGHIEELLEQMRDTGDEICEMRQIIVEETISARAPHPIKRILEFMRRVV